MPKKFTITKKEVSRVKKWLFSAKAKGHLYLDERTVMHLDTPQGVQDLFYSSDFDDDLRKRLQTALAVYRSREKKKSKNVVKTELDAYARKVLLAVAKERNITTSELIMQTFENEYDALDDFGRKSRKYFDSSGNPLNLS